MKEKNKKANIPPLPLYKYYKNSLHEKRGKMQQSEYVMSIKKATKLIPTIKVKFEERKTIDGKTEIMPVRVGDGSIIKLFDRTPYPEQSHDVVCPHFLELKWANGCNFNCAWCYLQGTFRFRPMKKKPYIKDMNKTKQHLLSFFNQVTDKSYLLNSGELSDSLVYEYNGYSISENIAPLFLQQEKHKLLILTKSSDISKLLKLAPTNKIVVSFSINADEVSKRWEKGAPSVHSRLKAAKKIQDAGFELRLRIDPMVPVENWESYYKSLLEWIFDEYGLMPSRITLGSLRGLQSTINNASDTSWTKYLEEKSNWGKKISIEKRFAMYSLIRDTLEEDYGYNDIALCKETIEMWEKLGMNYKKIKCNCIK